MKCPKCGAEASGGKFCSECGAPITAEQIQPCVDHLDPSHAIKICLNCGDKLLPAAKKCPTCGAKAKDFPLVDKSDKAKIDEIISNVPHPKENMKPKWEQNLEIKEQIWSKASEPSQHTIIKDRIKENKEKGIACCPKCGSTSLSANKKGFGIGKAVIGAWAAGPVGLVAGNIGAKKVVVTCLNCGHQWKI